MNKTNIPNIHQNKKRASKPSAGYKIDDFINDEDIIDNYVVRNYITNYRSFYEDQIESIPENWEVHHIDFNHNNNHIDNLIAVPKIVHVTIHKCGLCSKEEIEQMIEIYKSSILDENDLDSNDSTQSIHIS
jgi:hypothetical protein